MTMATPPTIKLPPVTLSHTAPYLKVRSNSNRNRSGSIVKVQQVGGSSVELDQDQGAYANINAEWVNRKGTFGLYTTK